MNRTFFQPFLSYITRTKTTLSLSSEPTYDWEAEEWAVPVNLTLNQLVLLGGLPVQFGVGGRYWVDSPEFGPEGWGFRAQVTFLLPR